MHAMEKLRGHCVSEAEKEAINVFQDMILTIRWMKNLQRSNQKDIRTWGESNP